MRGATRTRWVQIGRFRIEWRVPMTWGWRANLRGWVVTGLLVSGQALHLIGMARRWL